MSLLQNSNAIESGGYNINNSLRLRKSATGYLNRTFATPTSSTTWTVSLWFKRGEISSAHSHLFTTSLTDNFIRFQTSTDILQYAWANGSTVQSTAVFRDPSAWYHLVVAVDTTQATSSNRIRMYINGSEIAYGTSTYPALNATTLFNTARAHYLSFTSNQFDGYVAEVNWIDGQQLTPTSFGETDTTTGVWKPKAYSGTYGTNGFYLKFADASAATAAAIGKDSSGNGNNWTPTNISVTAGTTYDAMTDSPTLTSATVSNYCVLNDISTLTTATLSNANLAFTTATTGHNAIGSMGMSSGKYYWEAETSAGTTQARATVYSTAASTYYSFAANNTVYGFRFDADAGTLDYTTNGTSFTSLATGLTSGPYFPYFNNNGTTSKTISVNFGQRPFTYTPPTGYTALNTFNLPDSTIVKGNSYMDATLYTGTNASLSVTNAAGFRPDFVWVKGRSGATDHALYDAVRGTTNDLVSNNDTAATTQAQGLTAFNSNGFTVGTLAKMNTNAATYVAWQWQAGSSTVTNTSGSISAQVRANTTTGFSIVTYTGTGANATVGHGLGVAPKLLIVKQRNAARSWQVWHEAFLGTQYIILDSSNNVQTDVTRWNSTIPTSTVFSVGTANGTNLSGGTYLAYCWTNIAEFSRFGSYTGNGSTNGPFVYTGFRPKFLLIKNSTTLSTNWFIFDSTRDTYNVMFKRQQVNASSAEETNLSPFDFLSNGFKLRDTNSTWNASSATIIYAAFAENPFKNSLAR